MTKFVNLIGKKVGQYEIISLLGIGYSSAYKARQVGKMNREVVLNVMFQEFSEDKNFIQRFIAETNVLAKLQHPRILPIFDCAEDNGFVYLVTPFIGNDSDSKLGSNSLMNLLQGKPLPLLKINHFISQIAEGLDYAHAKNIVHSCLQPSRVLIDEHDNCFLRDFNFTTIIAQGSVLSVYDSPEKLGHNIQTHHSNIYSLGVIAYEMATGRIPFKEDTTLNMLIKIITKPIPPPTTFNPDLPLAVEHVLLKALAKEPTDRYASAGEFAKALSQAIQATPTSLARYQIKKQVGQGAWRKFFWLMTLSLSVM